MGQGFGGPVRPPLMSDGRFKGDVNESASVLAGDEKIYSPDGRYVLAVKTEKKGLDPLSSGMKFEVTVQVLEAASGRLLASRLIHTGYVNGMAFSPDGRLVATASDDQTAQVWEWATDSPPYQLKQSGRFLQIVFSPDGRYLATVAFNSGAYAQVWDWPQPAPGTRRWPDGKSFPLKEKSETEARDVAFSPDGRLIVTASSQSSDTDTVARVWDTQKFGPPLLTLQGHFAPVVTVAFSPDGRFILTGGEDGLARLWDATNGKPLADLFGSEQHVRHVAFGGDGRSIFVVSGAGAGHARRYACTVCGPAEELLTVAKGRGAWRMPAAVGVAAK
jgi:WD40 repeat protein